MAYTSATKRRGIDPAVTHHRVMTAAEDLVLSGTFVQATVTELAERAGVSRATVFSRFGSKLGVLEALAVRCAGGPQMQSIRAATAMTDPVAGIRALIHATCEHWERQGHILLTLKAIAELEPGALALIDDQRTDQQSTCEHFAHELGEHGRTRGLARAQSAAALHLVTSVESFMELRRDAGLSLVSTRRVLTALVEGIFDLDEPTTDG